MLLLSVTLGKVGILSSPQRDLKIGGKLVLNLISDGRYCYSYTICGERKWLYASDLAELRELERRIEHDKDDGIRTQEASKITLNDMFGTYISTKTTIKTSTRENYLYLWNKYIRPTPLAHQSLINIKTSDIKKLYGDLLANGFRTNSLDSINNLVHPTLEMAVDDDLIRKNPSKGVYRALKEKDCKMAGVHKTVLAQ